jgi:uncharacterized protein YdaL
MRARALSPLFAVASLLVIACGSKAARTDPRAAPAPALVLFDPSASGFGETQAIAMGHLVSHFGSWRVKGVAEYAPGDLDASSMVAYVGVDPGAGLPAAFLDDVLSGRRPVLWLAGNVDALVTRDPGFTARFGFAVGPTERPGTAAVEYKGARLLRDARDGTVVRGASIVDGAKAQVLATAVRADGSRFPWAVRAGHLTYVGEVPFSYAQDGDRALAVADILFDLVAPGTPERHRGLVRIEDVSPILPPENLRAVADTLASLGAPFSVAVIPVFEDPLGAFYGDGKPLHIAMRDAPRFVEALRYMVDRGGTLVMHGYTHQFSNVRNPYSGMSGQDFEFWSARMQSGAVHLTGPIPGDSAVWTTTRVKLGLAEFAASGLPAPQIFEFPHYAASPSDARAVRQLVPNAYHRGLYFPGVMSGSEDLSNPLSQTFPYDVTDVYGFPIVPENCGFYSPTPDGFSSHSVPELVARAAANKVVRDGFASFFFHPWFDPALLRDAVSGMEGLGYTFVRPMDVLEGSVAGSRIP